MLVSRPIAANAIDWRNVVPAIIHALASAGIGQADIATDPKTVTHAIAQATSSSWVLVAITADAPQIDVAAAMSCASVGSTPSSSPIQMVKAKEARTVATTMPRAAPPISMAWLEGN